MTETNGSDSWSTFVSRHEKRISLRTWLLKNPLAASLPESIELNVLITLQCGDFPIWERRLLGVFTDSGDASKCFRAQSKSHILRSQRGRNSL
jgi:hypothetical protein